MSLSGSHVSCRGVLPPMLPSDYRSSCAASHVAIRQWHVVQQCSAVGCCRCHVTAAGGVTMVRLPLGCTCTHNIMSEKKKGSMTYHCSCWHAKLFAAYAATSP